MWGFLAFLQFVTYVMTITKWFMVDHYAFWHGFKELIWALCPVINVTYVWDWWAHAVVVGLFLFQKFIEVSVTGVMWLEEWIKGLSS